MTYRKMDANGDYVVGTGNDFLSNSPATVAQAVLTALNLYAGEWFLDTSAGVPYFTEVLGKYTQGSYDTILKQAILDVTGVTALSSYSSSYDPSTRALSVSASIQTVYGPTAVQTTL